MSSGTQAATACSGTLPPVNAPSGAWQCTLDDEFNASSLDPNTWQPTLTSLSNLTTGPSGSKVCYVNNPNTISESGGYLNLTVLAVQKSFACKKMSGAAITTRYQGGMVNSMGLFDQEFGFFQVRAEIPASSVPGLQETLWLYPENETLYGPWPDSGEIDFAEFYSKYPNLDVPVVHYPGSTRDPNATNQNCSLTGQNTAGQFHTYGVMWTPTTITTYYDGRTCMTDTYASHVTYPDKAPEPFNQPFFLTFTAALGYGGGNTFSATKTPLPATTKVDWARVWQY